MLLVDDDPQLLAMVRVLVERARPDAAVVYARDVKTAEWLMRSTTLRLVLTDLKMDADPRAGLTVVALASELGIPVAVLTGHEGGALGELRTANVPVIAKLQLASPSAPELIAILDSVFAD